MVAAGCRNAGPRPVTPVPITPDPTCGDAHLDEGEECDGSDFGMATCKSQGFDEGQLICDSSCRFVQTLCVKRCGNGVLDPNEACDGDAGVPGCATFGYQACTSACQLEVKHCVTPAFETGPSFFMAKGGAAVVGDVPPLGPRDLVMAVPSFGRVETFPWLAQQGFQQSQGRKLSFEVTPVAPRVADVNRDGLPDIVTLNDDGALDALLAKTSGFSRVALTAQRCAGGHFIGSSPDSIALSCGSNVLVTHFDGGAAVVNAPTPAFTGDLWSAGAGSIQRLPGPDFTTDGGRFNLPGSPSQIALGDLDADGDLDLVALQEQTVTLFENSGLDFAAKQSFSALGATDLRVVDLDLDGRSDLIWLGATDVHIWRGHSSLVFTEFLVSLGSTSPRFPASFADVDGDGDLDLVITFSEGESATRTDIHLNRVR